MYAFIVLPKKQMTSNVFEWHHAKVTIMTATLNVND